VVLQKVCLVVWEVVLEVVQEAVYCDFLLPKVHYEVLQVVLQVVLWEVPLVVFQVGFWVGFLREGLVVYEMAKRDWKMILLGSFLKREHGLSAIGLETHKNPLELVELKQPI